MRRTTIARLDDLERGDESPRRLVVVFGPDQEPTAADRGAFEQHLAGARAELGADDILVIVTYGEQHGRETTDS